MFHLLLYAIIVGCRANSDCPSKKSCINENCVDPCEHHDPCVDPEECEVRDHEPFCVSGK